MMPPAAECLLGIRSAFMLLTRIPLGMSTTPGPDPGARWAVAHLPLVGAFIGLIGAAVWALSASLEVGVRAWLVIAFLLLLTGALHEDGLADTADALGGAFTRRKLFEILKDSRIGSYGALALVVALSLRAALLTRLLAESCWLIVLSQTVSRFAPVVLLRCLPYVSPEGASRSHAVVQSQNGQWAVAGAWTLVVCSAVVYFAHISTRRLLLSLGVQVVAVLWMAFRFKRRAGGVTGDFLGATQQIGELAFLLGLAGW
jgi:adenosylcobinamide-GDP ribazoletransferase